MNYCYVFCKRSRFVLRVQADGRRRRTASACRCSALDLALFQALDRLVLVCVVGFVDALPVVRANHAA